ncbi:MAG: hypothetical protein RSF67_04640, partial [Clostridia bacterium]
KRYLMIYKECLKRNLSVECYVSNWDIYKHNRMFANDYNEHIHDTNILVERISDRLINGKKKIYHFYGNKISVEDSIKLIQTNNESIK